ncbi:hypothetical protein QBC36DRAFT_369188 [Triangularia setosa]|uniref:Uncharacterized protein n=1 Tax=Triangularia setosa TaxID=2587417 RepID=A0AAN7A2D6_9PEZI|nr:hypothetical protein QBC36DRAFT_369188 [Podospora setosa]
MWTNIKSWILHVAGTPGAYRENPVPYAVCGACQIIEIDIKGLPKSNNPSYDLDLRRFPSAVTSSVSAATINGVGASTTLDMDSTVPCAEQSCSAAPNLSRTSCTSTSYRRRVTKSRRAAGEGADYGAPELGRAGPPVPTHRLEHEHHEEGTFRSQEEGQDHAIAAGFNPQYDPLHPGSVYHWLGKSGNFPSRPDGKLDTQGWTFQERGFFLGAL